MRRHRAGSPWISGPSARGFRHARQLCASAEVSFSSCADTGSYLAGMRVLVVEDEVRMAGLLERALREEGHAVDVAADGPEGLWLATENAYGAIVLDVMLPGLDGFQLCRRLRESGKWVPVLMLTARDACRRPGTRARRGRGRLPGQAVQPARAGRAAAGAGPAGRPVPAGNPGRG